MARPLSAVIAFAGFAFLFAFTASPASARDDDDKTDPVVDGKKASMWVDTLINDASARKRALAIEARCSRRGPRSSTRNRYRASVGRCGSIAPRLFAHKRR